MIDLRPEEPAEDSAIEPGPPIWIAVWIGAGLTLWALIVLGVQTLI